MVVGDADKSAPHKSSLAIPEWFPEQLESSARLLHERALDRSREEAMMVEAIITDPRMELVWIELQKRRRISHRKTQELLHPPQIGGLPIPRADIDIRRRAMEEVLWFASLAPRLPQVARSFPSYGERANQLRSDAERLRADLPGAKAMRLASRLVKAAEAYEELAGLELESSNRAVVTDIAAFMSERFGSPMHGLTAAIASVILGREISHAKVREWFSRHARKKTKRSMGKSAKKIPRSP